jgi:hypothetical protein
VQPQPCRRLPLGGIQPSGHKTEAIDRHHTLVAAADLPEGVAQLAALQEAKRA